MLISSKIEPGNLLCVRDKAVPIGCSFFCLSMSPFFMETPDERLFGERWDGIGLMWGGELVCWLLEFSSDASIFFADDAG